MFYILENKYKFTCKNIMGGLDRYRGVRRPFMCLTILVSEKHELVSEKSGKSQAILFHQSAGNPESEYLDDYS
jgi:hypothetical protein